MSMCKPHSEQFTMHASSSVPLHQIVLPLPQPTNYAVSEDYMIDLKHGDQYAFPYWYLHETSVKQRWEYKSLQYVLLTEWSYLEPMMGAKSISSYCRNKQITINKLLCTPSQILKHEDIIYIIAHKHEPPVIYHMNDNSKQHVGSLTVIHETDNLIVILKPATIPTHPSSLYRKNSIINMIQNGYYTKYDYSYDEKESQTLKKNNFSLISQKIMKRYLNKPKLKDNKNENEKQFYIVHRLDRLTSGLLIIAKNILSTNYLMKQFRERLVSKTYYALVNGRFDGDRYDIIDAKISKSSASKCYNRMVLSGYGRECETHFELIWYDPNRNISLVLCEPRTGRTHQIRVHLAYVAGTPIINDPLYNRSYDVFHGEQIFCDNKVLHQVNNGNLRKSNTKYDIDKFKCYVCDDNDASIDLWWKNLVSTTSVSNNGIYLHAFQYRGKYFQFQTPTPTWVSPADNDTIVFSSI